VLKNEKARAWMTWGFIVKALSSIQRVWEQFGKCANLLFLVFFAKKGQNYLTSKCAGPANFSPILL
jgi:hypothetical protein